MKKRNKKSLTDMGKQVKISSSYFACITPMVESKRIDTKIKGSMAKNNTASVDSISNCESFSTSSIADSDIIRCNVRTCNGSGVGKKLWGSIEALGVVSGRDITMNERMIDALEFRDKEGAVVSKVDKIISP